MKKTTPKWLLDIAQSILNYIFKFCGLKRPETKEKSSKTLRCELSHDKPT